MSAITGIINFKKNLYAYKAYNRLLVRDMTASMEYRGDESAEFVGEHIAFSHLGKTMSHPVKKTVEGYEFVISSSGRLFNSDELRADLKNRGYTFETETDAEVILYCYIHYGDKCCEKLDGGYAFAIWDSMRQQVFICRDRFGIKPFFYSICGDTFIFASEIKAIFRYPFIKPKIDINGLRGLFTMSPFKLSGESVFSEVNELPPAHIIIINRSGIKLKKYWQVECREHNESCEETAEHLKELINNSLNISDFIDINDTLSTCSCENLLKYLYDTVLYYDLPGMGKCDFYTLHRLCEIKKNHDDILCPVGFNFPVNGNDLSLLALKEQCNLPLIANSLKPAIYDTLKLDDYFENSYNQIIKEVPLSGDEDEDDKNMRERMWIEFMYLIPHKIGKIERLCAKLGVWAYFPLCDRKLFEYVWNIPCSMRNVVGEVFNQQLTNETPPSDSMADSCYQKAIRELLSEILNDTSSPLLAFVDKMNIENICNEKNQNVDRFAEFLVQTDYWLQKFRPIIV